MSTPLLEFNDKGIYCSQADVYLDPWKPVKNAIITHGHADHSRWGNERYITHSSNVSIIKHRLGVINVIGKEWNETFVINNVKFSFHPAGHIIGSAQIRVEHKGEVWVFTGDYKTEDDGISVPYEVVKKYDRKAEKNYIDFQKNKIKKWETVKRRNYKLICAMLAEVDTL